MAGTEGAQQAYFLSRRHISAKRISPHLASNRERHWESAALSMFELVSPVSLFSTQGLGRSMPLSINFSFYPQLASLDF